MINARGERVPGQRPGESVESRAESIFKVSFFFHSINSCEVNFVLSVSIYSARVPGAFSFVSPSARWAEYVLWPLALCIEAFSLIGAHPKKP